MADLQGNLLLSRDFGTLYEDTGVGGLRGAPDEILIVKRSIVIDGHKTSVSLEEAFWGDLKKIARAQEATVSDLVAKIDQTRQQGISPRQSAYMYSNNSVRPRTERQLHSEPTRLTTMRRLPLIYLVLVMSFVPEMNLILIVVCWHLYANGCGWSSDETAAKSLAELAMRNRSRRLARRSAASLYLGTRTYT